MNCGRWFCFLFGILLWGCSLAAPSPQTPTLPEAPPPTTEGITVEPPCTPPPLTVFFTAPSGTGSLLYLYDEKVQDVWTFPAAGVGVRNPKTGPHDSVLFDRDWQIFQLFYLTECLCRYDTGPGYAFAPNIDGAENIYFLGTDTLAQAEAGIGDLGILLCPQELEIWPESLNQVGRSHGGITSFGIAKTGYPLAFTTLDGKLFISHVPATESVYVLDTGIQNADDVDIDEKGNLIVWVDTKQNLILLSPTEDFQTPCPLFVANPEGGVLRSPRFKGDRPYYITYVSTSPDGVNYRFAYNLCNGLTRTLSAIEYR